MWVVLEWAECVTAAGIRSSSIRWSRHADPRWWIQQNVLSGFDSVYHEHRHSHGSHTSGYWSDEARLLSHAWIGTGWGGGTRLKTPETQCSTFYKHTTVVTVLPLPSKSTSPTNRCFPVTGSCTRFIPTSITAAPSLIMSAVMRFGIPDEFSKAVELETTGTMESV